MRLFTCCKHCQSQYYHVAPREAELAEVIPPAGGLNTIMSLLAPAADFYWKLALNAVGLAAALRRENAGPGNGNRGRIVSAHSNADDSFPPAKICRTVQAR